MAHERAHPGLGRPCAEGRDLLLRVLDRAPGARVVREHLEALAAELTPAADGLADPAGRRDVGAESHADYPTVVARERPEVTGPARVRFAPSPTGNLHVGGGADGAVQLARGPAHRRHPRAARRGHRPRALHGRQRGRDPARAHVAGARLGRGAVPPERARRRLRRRGRATARRRRRLPGLRVRRGARGPARRGSRRQAGPGRARPPRPRRRRDRRAGGRGPGAGVALRGRDPRRHRDRGLRPGAGHLRPRPDRGLRGGALGRHAHLQPCGRGGRPGDGDQPRHPRRGPHLQHAQADDGDPRAGRDPARVRPHPADPGRGQAQAQQAPRGGVGGGPGGGGLHPAGGGQRAGAPGMELRRQDHHVHRPRAGRRASRWRASPRARRSSTSRSCR